MFENFLLDLHSKLIESFQDLESTFVSDYSGFVYVDGEEGDHGTIKYFDTSNNLVAIKTIYGGDCEDVVFTPIGVKIIWEKVQIAINLLAFQNSP